jgi:hypothetical protein
MELQNVPAKTPTEEEEDASVPRTHRILSSDVVDQIYPPGISREDLKQELQFTKAEIASQDSDGIARFLIEAESTAAEFHVELVLPVPFLTNAIKSKHFYWFYSFYALVYFICVIILELPEAGKIDHFDGSDIVFVCGADGSSG